MGSIPVLLKQYRNGLTAFVAALVALFLIVSVRPGSGALLREPILAMTAPIQRLFSAPISVFVNIRKRMKELNQLERDNRRLRGELALLRPLGVRLEELELENQRLRKLLGMRPDPSYQEVAARVIGDSASAFARSFTINAGRKEGVQLDATVLAEGGLLGRVVERSDHSALILTLLDINSRVPILVQRTRTRAIAAGMNSRLLSLEFASKDAEVQTGDVIITSGTGGYFPKGLVVGRVRSITGGSGLFRKFNVEPVVDFDRTEEVRILLNGRKSRRRRGLEPMDDTSAGRFHASDADPAP